MTTINRILAQLFYGSLFVMLIATIGLSMYRISDLENQVEHYETALSGIKKTSDTMQSILSN